jgi:hypothetical protein
LRVGGLAYGCNDTLSEAAITDIMGPRLSAGLALRPKHLDRPGYFVVWWLRRRRRLLHDRGLVADPLQHRRGQAGFVAAEGGELADHAAANRVRGDLDRRFVLGDRGDV